MLLPPARRAAKGETRQGRAPSNAERDSAANQIECSTMTNAVIGLCSSRRCPLGPHHAATDESGKSPIGCASRSHDASRRFRHSRGMPSVRLIAPVFRRGFNELQRGAGAGRRGRRWSLAGHAVDAQLAVMQLG